MRPDNEALSTVAEPLLLKVPEACRTMRVSRSRLYLLMKTGEIRGILVGPGQRRIPMSECRAFVERKLAEQIRAEPGAA